MQYSVLYPSQPMSTLEGNFWYFHYKNPEVAKSLFEVLIKAFNRGFQQYGIAAAAEVVRWETGPVTEKTDGYKLNNSHRAFYSRLFQMSHPQYAHRIKIRTQISV